MSLGDNLSMDESAWMRMPEKNCLITNRALKLQRSLSWLLKIGWRQALHKKFLIQPHVAVDNVNI
jgi:hypothetical protein